MLLYQLVRRNHETYPPSYLHSRVQSSGKKVAARASKQVNTRAKAAMMLAVARHIPHVPASKAYYDKKRAEGKKHNQAIRAWGRQLVRVIWALVKHNRAYETR